MLKLEVKKSYCSYFKIKRLLDSLGIIRVRKTSFLMKEDDKGSPGSGKWLTFFLRKGLLLNSECWKGPSHKDLENPDCI